MKKIIEELFDDVELFGDEEHDIIELEKEYFDKLVNHINRKNKAVTEDMKKFSERKCQYKIRSNRDE